MAEEQTSDDTLQPLLRSKSYDDSEMDITPMIDIVFLLLIFFVVASKMDAAADVSLPKARYGMPVVEASSVMITLACGEKGNAIVYASDGKNEDELVPSGDLAAQEEEILRYVEETMAKDKTKTNVLLKAERGVITREVDRIAKAATAPEAVQQLYIAVMEVQ